MTSEGTTLESAQAITELVCPWSLAWPRAQSSIITSKIPCGASLCVSYKVFILVTGLLSQLPLLPCVLRSWAGLGKTPSLPAAPCRGLPVGDARGRLGSWTAFSCWLPDPPNFWPVVAPPPRVSTWLGFAYLYPPPTPPPAHILHTSVCLSLRDPSLGFSWVLLWLPHHLCLVGHLSPQRPGAHPAGLSSSPWVLTALLPPSSVSPASGMDLPP